MKILDYMLLKKEHQNVYSCAICGTEKSVKYVANTEFDNGITAKIIVCHKCVLTYAGF